MCGLNCSPLSWRGNQTTEREREKTLGGGVGSQVGIVYIYRMMSISGGDEGGPRETWASLVKESEVLSGDRKRVSIVRSLMTDI